MNLYVNESLPEKSTTVVFDFERRFFFHKKKLKMEVKKIKAIQNICGKNETGRQLRKPKRSEV